MHSQLIIILCFFITGCNHYEQKLNDYQPSESSTSRSTPVSFSLEYFKILLVKDFNEAIEYKKKISLTSKQEALANLEIIKHHKGDMPAIKLLNKLSDINVLDLSEDFQIYYADLMFSLISEIPNKTLSTYQSLDQFSKPWIELKQIANQISDRKFKNSTYQITQWRNKYPRHPALQIILDEYHSLLENNLIDIKNIAIVSKSKSPPHWFEEFITLIEKRNKEISVFCFFNDTLVHSYELLKQQNKIDLVLAVDYEHDDFSTLSNYHLDFPTLALITPFETKIDNLWFLSPRGQSDKAQLYNLAESNPNIFIIYDESSMLFDPSSYASLKISRQDYKEKILQSLEIPNRKKEFENKFYGSIDYLALPSRQYSTVLLMTSEELARLSYPYWKLKSPVKTTFIGPASLLVHDINLDKSLFGMMLPKAHFDYNARIVFDLLQNWSNFILDKTLTLTDPSEVVLRRRGHVFSQDDRLDPFYG